MLSPAADRLNKLKVATALAAGQRLPTLRELAATWGVSPGSVQVTVEEAVRQGWLETRPGSGIWAQGCLPKPEALRPKLDAQRLAASIATDIQTGKLASGQSLPTPSEFSARLGIHPATVRKAFALLQSQEVIDRQGRSWTVRRPLAKTTSRAPVVLCIGAADSDGNLRVESDREWDFWREIQIEAIRCGLEPRLMTADTFASERFDAFGAIVSTWHQLDSTPLLDALLRQRLPTSVWIVNQESLPGKRYSAARTMWFHDLSYGRDAGVAMANYLAPLKHQKIAWISPFQASAWAKNRLAGLREALPKHIELFEANGDWISEWDIQVLVAEDPEVIGRIRLDGIDHGGAIDALRRPLVEAVTRERCLKAFTPQLEAARSTGATLWVAASDLIAQWCLHWLRSRQLQSPRDLALVSFDDTREASRSDLTSLRFDVQGMARSMIRQILSRHDPHRILSHYNGLIVERGSTSNAALRG